MNLHRGKIEDHDMMRMMTLLGVGSFHMRTSTGNNNHIGGESFTNICMIAAIWMPLELFMHK
jgi:hypothetical protein